MNRRRTARRTDDSEYIPRSGVADRDLPALGRFEVHAEESGDDERRSRIGRGLVGERAGLDVFRRRALEQLIEGRARQPREETLGERVADLRIVDAASLPTI
jgi:hypothetical protein